MSDGFLRIYRVELFYGVGAHVQWHCPENPYIEIFMKQLAIYEQLFEEKKLALKYLMRRHRRWNTYFHRASEHPANTKRSMMVALLDSQIAKMKTAQNQLAKGIIRLESKLYKLVQTSHPDDQPLDKILAKL